MGINMRKSIGDRILAVLLAFLIALSMLPITVVTVHAVEGTVLFVVTDSSTDLPVESANFSLEGVGNTTTNSNGEAEFTGLSDGSYNYTVFKLGYSEVSDTVTLPTEGTISVSMTPLLTVTVEGTVKDCDGNGIEAAAVEVTGYTNYSTTTDSEGNFALEVYAEKDYTISVSKDGYITQSDIKLDLEGSNDVVLEAEATTKSDQAPLSFAEDELTSLTVGEKHQYTACGGSVQGGIEYTVDDQTVLSIEQDGTAEALSAGTAVITATLKGNDEYKDVSVSITVSVKKAEFAFEDGSDDKRITILDTEYSNTAIHAAGDVTYSSDNEEYATVDEKGTVTPIKLTDETVPYVTITAKDGEGGEGKEISYKIFIVKAEQTISFENNTTEVNFYDNENIFMVSAKTDVDELQDTVQYSIVTGPAEIAEGDEVDGKIRITGAGEIMISASFSGNGDYEPANRTFTLTVNKYEQTIAFDQEEYSVCAGDEFSAPQAKVTSQFAGEGAITYAIENNEAGIIDEGSFDVDTGAFSLKFGTAGEATIIATKAADDNHKSASAEYTLTVNWWEPEEQPYTLEGKKGDNGWYTGDVTISAKDGYTLIQADPKDGDDVFNANITDGSTTVKFRVKNSEGDISDIYSVEIKRDTEKPTASLKADGLSSWEKFLSIISFGTWEKDTVDFTIERSDAVSGVAKVEYHVDYVDTENENQLSQGELDSIQNWNSYEDTGISVGKDSVFFVYAKVTDYAGNVNYAYTNGIIFESIEPTVKIALAKDFERKDIYNCNVPLTVTVEDPKVTVEDRLVASGIKSVIYTIKKDGVETKSEELYSFENDDPRYSDLETSKTFQIEVDAEENDSSNVVVYVEATDNAGNTYEESFGLSISVTPPQINVIFENEPEIIASKDGVNYYDAVRTATVTISGRSDTLVEPNADVISIEESRGTTAEGQTYTVDEWKLSEDGGTYTTTVRFSGSAVYESFKVNYTDRAGNCAEGYTADKFAVDLDDPTGTVTIEQNTWDSLIDTLTFHLWKNGTATVSVTKDDATSTVELVEYIKTDKTTRLTEAELQNGWKPFDEFEQPSDNERFTVYIRLTDLVGHTSIISSDGYIVDQTDSTIVLEIQDEANKNGYYREDVDISITVQDAEPYSGIQKIEYWVTSVNDGINAEKTQEQTLYSFEYDDQTGNLTIIDVATGETGETSENDVPLTYDLLKSSWTGCITVDSALNNSDDVNVHIKVTDNAGNTYEKNMPLKIDVTAPKVLVTFDNNNPYSADETGRSYFGDNRTATIAITERTSTFNEEKATAGIQITGLDGNGKTVNLDINEMVKLNDGKWSTEEVEGKPNEAIHTLQVEFTADANYEFTLSYEDEAGNRCVYQKNETNPETADEEVQFAEGTAAPRYFTVDHTKPTDYKVTIDENNTWNKIMEVLTFKLYSRDTATVSASATDATSPFIISFYKTTDKDLKSENDLAALAETEWQHYDDDKFTVDPNEAFAVYVRVRDYAGNTVYFSSDGYIVDNDPSAINVNVPNGNGTHNGVPVFNKDVTLTFSISDEIKDANGVYADSGIKSVRYWIINYSSAEACASILGEYEGNVEDTKVPEIGEKDKLTVEPTILYTFEYEGDLTYDKLVHTLDSGSEYSTINVVGRDNNSCYVRVFIQVEDNAGNVYTKTVPLDFDMDSPTISISFDNNSARDGKYYNEPRTATISYSDSRSGHLGTLSVNTTGSVSGTTVKFNTDGKHTLSASVNDIAGNAASASVEDFVIDLTTPTGIIDVPNGNGTHNGVPVFNEDVTLNFSISDEIKDAYGVYVDSGIKSVKYWIINYSSAEACASILDEYKGTVEDTKVPEIGEKDKLTVEPTPLYTFEHEGELTDDKLVHTLDSGSKYTTINVIGRDNNSCYVRVFIQVEDNAGNVYTKTVPLDFDMDSPTISISFDNNSARNGKYYKEPRTATISYSDSRPEHLGELSVNTTGSVSGATVIFNTDGEYTLSASVNDIAGNVASASVEDFVIDLTSPTGTIKVNGFGTWDSLLDTLTFGLWSRDTVSVSGEFADETSPIESVSYYKTSAVNALSAEELNALSETEWTAFESFNVPADEQFSVYVRIIDYAGNVTYISTDGIIVDSNAPVEESISPEITINPPQPINDIYSGDVKMAISVTDPTWGETYSGLKEISYRVSNLGKVTQEDTLYSFTGNTPSRTELLENWSGEITVESELNNSNDVVIEVTATDNAGNTSSDSVAIKIDTTAPTIDISYSNNSPDSGSYFDTERIATIVVTERNFDPEDVDIAITNTDGAVPAVSGWAKTAGSGNEDDTTWTATIVYGADGDYTFDIAYTDLAGNRCKSVRYGDSVMPTEFTIDKTAPVISVSYSNNNAANGKYFNAPRTATVTVTEHNFDVSRVEFTQTAMLNGVGISVPAASWVSSGDVHIATITYTADGDYTFDVTIRDKAGNQNNGVNYGGSAAAQEFTVDQTIEKPVISGVENGKAYKDDVIPTINFGDINFSSYEIELLRTRLGEKDVDVTEDFIKGITQSAQGGSGSCDFFDQVVENDGIYTLNVRIFDLAGNEDSETVSFTVNRFGSVYVYDDYLISLIENGGAYVTSVENDLVITEYNADRLVSGSLNIEVTCDGKPLESIAYNVSPVINDQVAVGDSGWFQYQYTISKENFAADGVYKISIASKDATGNMPESTPDNSVSAKGNAIVDAIEFTVDSTAPEITSIVGLEENIINAEEVTVTYTVFDAIGLKSLTVYVNGQQAGDVVTDFDSDLNNYSGSFVISESSTAQTVRIVVEDLAGNVTDTDSEDFSSVYAFNKSVTVSTNIFVRWYANKPLFWGSVGGVVVLAAAVVTVITIKRKKPEKTAVE